MVNRELINILRGYPEEAEVFAGNENIACYTRVKDIIPSFGIQTEIIIRGGKNERIEREAEKERRSDREQDDQHPRSCENLHRSSREKDHSSGGRREWDRLGAVSNDVVCSEMETLYRFSRCNQGVLEEFLSLLEEFISGLETATDVHHGPAEGTGLSAEEVCGHGTPTKMVL